MKLQLIDGQFSQEDSTTILSQVFHVKIKYHEDKIENTQNEEDIKMRERKIKKLQSDLYDAIQFIKNSSGSISMSSDINI